ncbi:acyltransferase-domain-containing protein [Phyllosticta citrichinensis]
MPPPTRTPAQSTAKHNLGAGLNFKSPSIDPHPSGPPKHGQFGQAERGVSVASTFLSGVLAINAAQFIGLPFKMIDPKFYNDYIAFTKQSFAVLVTTLTQWWSPTKVHVSGDASLPGQLVQRPDGSLECNFPRRIILMANHQLYTDWLYLWWIAYTNKMAGHVYIILKESLRNIPLIGWGCQFYNFIFLARNWEHDKPRFQQHLDDLSDPNDPMWLIIFPEGTNLSATTRQSSKRWAEKNGIQDMRHQLLPRSTGLRFCLQNLRKSTEWLYDCTIGYEGIPLGKYGQDIFTLQSSFMEGRPPKSVNMHWRRFKISQIPVDDPEAFEVWLRNRWKEKDHYLDYFSRTGHFPSQDPWKAKSSKEIREIKPARAIEAEVKSGSWGEFLAIFAPITAFLTVLFLFYGASVGALFEGLPKVNDPPKLKQAQESGQLKDGALPQSLAKKALKNARAADPAASVASGTSVGKPQYGEWDAIRQTLAERGLEGKGVGSFAPKAPSTADPVEGHRSFSQPGMRKPNASSDSTVTAAKARQPLKLNMSDDALRKLLEKHLGKAKDSKQLAQQTIRLANGQVIKANAPETTAVQDRERSQPVKLANGLTVSRPAPASSRPGPVKLASGQTVLPKGRATSEPSKGKAATPGKPPLKKSTAGPPKLRPLRNSTPVTQPVKPQVKPMPSTVLPAAKKTPLSTATPSLGTGPTRTTSSAVTPAQSPGQSLQSPKKIGQQSRPAQNNAKAPQAPKPKVANAKKKPAKPVKHSDGGWGRGRAIPLSVAEPRGPKDLSVHKEGAIEKRKHGTD